MCTLTSLDLNFNFKKIRFLTQPHKVFQSVRKLFEPQHLICDKQMSKHPLLITCPGTRLWVRPWLVLRVIPGSSGLQARSLSHFPHITNVSLVMLALA